MLDKKLKKELLLELDGYLRIVLEDKVRSKMVRGLPCCSDTNLKFKLCDLKTKQ
jgi:hypothetical protein